MKVNIKDKIIDVPDYFEVKGNMLYNNNTKKYEGADGDIVTVNQYNISKRGHVKEYTESQIIPTYEWPIDECTFNALTPDMGINGLFMAGVYSPKYTSPNEHPIDHLHSVLCDINFNIVFDPQPEYEKVVNYPYSRLIGYNGIRSIDVIRKIE